MPHIPLIEDLTMGPVPAGSNISVEFAGASQWYGASVSIVSAEASRILNPWTSFFRLTYLVLLIE